MRKPKPLAIKNQIVQTSNSRGSNLHVGVYGDSIEQINFNVDQSEWFNSSISSFFEKGVNALGLNSVEIPRMGLDKMLAGVHASMQNNILEIKGMFKLVKNDGSLFQTALMDRILLEADIERLMEVKMVVEMML